jgi:hypothetical protein
MMMSSRFLLFVAVLIVVTRHVTQAHFCPHPRFMQKHICDACVTSNRAHMHSTQVVAWSGQTNTVIARMPASWYAGWNYGGYVDNQQAVGYTCSAYMCVAHIWECRPAGCHSIMYNVMCLIEHIEYNGHIVLGSLASCIPIPPNDPLCWSTSNQQNTGYGYYGGSTTWGFSYSNAVSPWGVV